MEILIKDWDNIKAGDAFDPDSFNDPDVICQTPEEFKEQVMDDIEDEHLTERDGDGIEEEEDDEEEEEEEDDEELEDDDFDDGDDFDDDDEDYSDDEDD